MNQSMRGFHWAVLLLAAVLLGSSFLMINVAVAEVPPFTIAAVRALAAAPLVWLFLRLTGGSLPPLFRDGGRAWLPFVVIGLLAGAIPFSAVAWGQQHIESGLGGILFGTIPVFAVLLGPFLVPDEGFSVGGLIGALIGFAGVVLVVGPSALAGAGDQLLGVAITLFAALSYTLSVMYVRRLTGFSPVAIAAGQLIAAALMLAPVALALDAPWTLSPGLVSLGAIAWVAIASTAVPMVLFFWLAQQVGATRTALVPLFMPVVAVGLGAAVLGEALPWSAYLGLVLIMAGAAAVSRRPAPAPERA